MALSIAGPACSPASDDHEPGRRQDGQPERHPADRRVDVSLADGQRVEARSQ